MGYYPTNFYSNYPYQNSYMPQQQMPQMTMMSQPQQTLPTQSSLNGRIVESIDVAKVAEVPLGGYGIFPKADLTEIYVKSWNSNGTTSIIPFRPYVEAEVVKEDESKKNYSSFEEESKEDLIQKINQLEDKLNKLIATTEELKKKESSKTEPKRKELNASAY